MLLDEVITEVKKALEILERFQSHTQISNSFEYGCIDAEHHLTVARSLLFHLKF